MQSSRSGRDIYIEVIWRYAMTQYFFVIISERINSRVLYVRALNATNKFLSPSLSHICLPQ